MAPNVVGGVEAAPVEGQGSPPPPAIVGNNNSAPSPSNDGRPTQEPMIPPTRRSQGGRMVAIMSTGTGGHYYWNRLGMPPPKRARGSVVINPLYKPPRKPGNPEVVAKQIPALVAGYEASSEKDTDYSRESFKSSEGHTESSKNEVEVPMEVCAAKGTDLDEDEDDDVICLGEGEPEYIIETYRDIFNAEGLNSYDFGPKYSLNATD